MEGYERSKHFTHDRVGRDQIPKSNRERHLKDQGSTATRNQGHCPGPDFSATIPLDDNPGHTSLDFTVLRTRRRSVSLGFGWSPGYQCDPRRGRPDPRRTWGGVTETSDPCPPVRWQDAVLGRTESDEPTHPSTVPGRKSRRAPARGRCTTHWFDAKLRNSTERITASTYVTLRFKLKEWSFHSTPATHPHHPSPLPGVVLSTATGKTVPCLQ